MSKLGVFPLELYNEIAKYDIKALCILRQCCLTMAGLVDKDLIITSYYGIVMVNDMFHHVTTRCFRNPFYKGIHIKCPCWRFTMVFESCINNNYLSIMGEYGNVFKRYQLRHEHTTCDNGLPSLIHDTRGIKRWQVTKHIISIGEGCYKIGIYYENSIIIYIETTGLENLAPRVLYCL
ncbi:hypothetical protein E24_00094 [Faustovirus]|nr:hypothetical protein PRJ_Fausto_00085 [Faustovirus]AMN83027.1 hypothetical protein E24_00094 [Faustovirus]AMN84012.1 hypothetical protein D5a_00094 [Faustovirus]AMN84997.1 hypothetical protein E23_00094 [Faustovirus]QBR98999.1 hypothetical protein [Faustovirus mariensis]